MTNQVSQQLNVALDIKNYNYPLEEDLKKQRETNNQTIEKEQVKSNQIDYTGVNHIFAAFYIKSMQKLKSEQANLNSNNLSRENSKKNSSLNINNSNNFNNNNFTSYHNLNNNQNKNHFRKEISEFSQDLNTHNNNNSYNTSNEEKKQKIEKTNYGNYNNNSQLPNFSSNSYSYSISNHINSNNNQNNNMNTNYNSNSAGGKIFNLEKVPEKANMLKKNGILNHTSENTNISNTNSSTAPQNNSSENSKENIQEINNKEKEKIFSGYSSLLLNSSSSIVNNNNINEADNQEILFSFNKLSSTDLNNKFISDLTLNEDKENKNNQSNFNGLKIKENNGFLNNHKNMINSNESKLKADYDYKNSPYSENKIKIGKNIEDKENNILEEKITKNQNENLFCFDYKNNSNYKSNNIKNENNRNGNNNNNCNIINLNENLEEESKCLKILDDINVEKEKIIDSSFSGFNLTNLGTNV